MKEEVIHVVAVVAAVADLLHERSEKCAAGPGFGRRVKKEMVAMLAADVAV